ncbi:type II secretion system minor pseudopilin GspI [Yersinia nurmii]|nr:type II secretion system minor pseudopilin GspI [Yersinia nurmii]MDN0087717.1 type II secretion system minor pseudopilin GspI [Yersinia nurmii]
MTLLEVMFSLIIFSTTGLAILQFMTQSIYLSNQAKIDVFSILIAENKLNEIILNRNLPSNSWISGHEYMIGKIWHWRARSEDIEYLGLMLIDIEVTAENNMGTPLCFKYYRAIN